MEGGRLSNAVFVGLDLKLERLYVYIYTHNKLKQHNHKMIRNSLEI